MHSATCLKLTAVFAALLVGSVGWASTIPYSTGFEASEGYVNGQPIAGIKGWTGSSTATATTARAHAGSMSAYVPQDASVTNAFGSSPSFVWTDFYAVPKFYEGDALTREPDTNTPSTAQFFISSNGYVVVHNGPYVPGQTNWVVRTSKVGGGAATPLSTGVWIRITVFHNYASNRWSLFVNGEFVAHSMGFMTNETQYQAFVAKDDVYLDTVGVDTNMPSGITADEDSDGLHDVWELTWFGTLTPTGSHDPDNDGLNNEEEETRGTNPLNSDTDGDGMPDGWEAQHSCLNPTVNDAGGDPDSDGLTNLQEYNISTNMNPCSSDTDSDGMPDGWEAQYLCLNPTVNDASGDADSDGLTNLQEYQKGTNPCNSDTDSDGMPDGWEDSYGLDPTDPTGDNGPNGDPDGDTCPNIQEYYGNSNPMDPNSTSFGIPYFEGFEPPSWTLGPVTTKIRAVTPSAESVSVVASPRLERLQSLSISSNGGVAVTVSDQRGTNVFCVMYVRPVLHESPPAVGIVGVDDAAALCVLTDGSLVGFSSNDWIDTGMKVPTNKWLGLGLHLDYGQRRWDLYVSTNETLGEVMVRANAIPMGFNTNYAGPNRITGLVITNTASTPMYVDNLAITFSGTNVSAALDRVDPDSRYGATSRYVRIDVEYVSANAANTLGGTAGRNLARGCMDGDIIEIWKGANGWNRYLLNGGAWQAQAGALPVTSVDVHPYTVIKLVRMSPVNDYGMGLFQSGATQAITQVRIGGPDENLNGWNLFRRLGATKALNNLTPPYRANALTNAVVDAAANNTYELRVPDQHPSRRFYYQSAPFRYQGTTVTNLWCEPGNYPSTRTIAQDAAVWMRRSGNGASFVDDNN